MAIASMINPAIVAGAFSSVVAILSAQIPSLPPAQNGIPSAGVDTSVLASNQFAILVTTVIGFLSMLAAHAFQMWREGRQRRWDIEDRRDARNRQERQILDQTEELRRLQERHAAELKHTAEIEAELTRVRAQKIEEALKLEQQRARLAIEVSAGKLERKIEESRQATEEVRNINVAALVAANDNQRKFNELQAQINAVRPEREGRRATDRAVEVKGQLEEIDHKLTDVVQTTHDIKHIVEEGPDAANKGEG